MNIVYQPDGYWSEMMQDECYLISDVGWKDGAKPFEVIKLKF